MLSTTATSASLPGDYPIDVSGAYSVDYKISYVDGMLAVLPDPPIIHQIKILNMKTGKHKMMKVIELQLSGALNATDAAQSLGIRPGHGTEEQA